MKKKKESSKNKGSETKKQEEKYEKGRQIKITDHVTSEDFELIKFLGKGGFAEVRLCRQINTGLVFAMKIMEQQHAKTSLFTSPLSKREEIAFKNNPFIVNLHYCFVQYDKYYWIMDYTEGGDLLELLNTKGTFNKTTTRFYIAELSLAIKSIHDLGFAHHDIKPDNILLDGFGHLKLADFGLGTRLVKSDNRNDFNPKISCRRSLPLRQDVPQHIKMSSIDCTPGYAAPEIFLGYGRNEKADWWSVGSVMYECLQGYNPFTTFKVPDRCCSTRPITMRHLRVIKNRTFSHAATLTLNRIRNEDARDLLSHLLCDSRKRYGFKEIRSHLFFKGFNWNITDKKAPFKNEIQKRIKKKGLNYSENYLTLDDIADAESSYIMESLDSEHYSLYPQMYIEKKNNHGGSGICGKTASRGCFKTTNGKKNSYAGNHRLRCNSNDSASTSQKENLTTTTTTTTKTGINRFCNATSIIIPITATPPSKSTHVPKKKSWKSKEDGSMVEGARDSVRFM